MKELESIVLIIKTYNEANDEEAESKERNEVRNVTEKKELMKCSENEREVCFIVSKRILMCLLLLLKRFCIICKNFYVIDSVLFLSHITRSGKMVREWPMIESFNDYLQRV